MSADLLARHLVAVLARLEQDANRTRFCDCGCWLIRGETCPACALDHANRPATQETVA